jgi:hypothetical protein
MFKKFGIDFRFEHIPAEKFNFAIWPERIEKREPNVRLNAGENNVLWFYVPNVINMTAEEFKDVVNKLIPIDKKINIIKGLF